MAATRKRFSTTLVTPPTAGEAVPDPTPPARRAVKTSEAKRIAFTWRLTPEQADQLDTLVLELRRQLGLGRLDRAAVLQALVDVATDQRNVRGAVAKRLDL